LEKRGRVVFNPAAKKGIETILYKGGSASPPGREKSQVRQIPLAICRRLD
jgi:hypothetical protein